MRSTVTFSCSIPANLEEQNPGQEVAGAIARGLSSIGYPVRVEEECDYCWTLYAMNSKCRTRVDLSDVGEKDMDWCAIISASPGCLGNLFGARLAAHERAEFAVKLHDALSRNAEFSSVRWHAAAWGPTGWATAPHD